MEATAAGEEAVSVSGDGAFDAASGAVSATVTLPAQAGATAPVQLRLVDGTAYLSGAPLTGQGQWVRLPLEAAGAAGVDTSALDPSRQLEQLRAVADDVREVPGVTVRGVETRGYAGTIDAAEALEQLPAEQRTAEAEQAAAEVGSVPFTLYVDEQDRPARTVVDLAVDGSTAELSMDYYDWGSDVDVAAPDPATVTDLPTGAVPAQQGA
ncbi:LppX_LprAFG lipoprotein [Kineococcus indalonis]|uniref:LppX_LprAFG lipoprotein n=1 Tax=Kineococcus indalonis TaxID=2696566 RepID=UPI001412B4D9|nr:LppX_LprAFG lipoprotein [Kineococcus indalonis]